MELETENAVKIGILETKVIAIHDRFDILEEKYDKQEDKIDLIVGYIDRGKGAWTLLLLITGTLGALMLKGVSFITAKLFS